jgi:hypothetical protein
VLSGSNFSTEPQVLGFNSFNFCQIISHFFFCPRNLFNPRVPVLLNLVLCISRFPVFCFEFGPVQNLGSWMASGDSKPVQESALKLRMTPNPKPYRQHWSKLKARNSLFHDTPIRKEKDDSCTIQREVRTRVFLS